MTRDEFVNFIKLRLGNNKDPSLDADILAYADFVQQQELERASFQAWFLLKERAEAPTAVGDNRIALPSDFIAEWEQGSLWRLEDGDPIQLIKDDFYAIKGRYTEKGKPVAYDIANDYFLLTPTPDRAYTLRMYYYGSEPLPSTLGANEDNEWLRNAADWLMGVVGETIAGDYLQNDRMAQRFGVHGKKGRDRVYRETVARTEENKPRSMGD